MSRVIRPHGVGVRGATLSRSSPLFELANSAPSAVGSLRKHLWGCCWAIAVRFWHRIRCGFLALLYGVFSGSGN